jgi:hypothetical protein
MPDREDEATAEGTIKHEHTKKRGSAHIETVTQDVEARSNATHTSPVGGTSATEASPKKRRKVNHGQNANPGAPILCDTRC